jgi:hypothetical protein
MSSSRSNSKILYWVLDFQYGSLMSNCSCHFPSGEVKHIGEIIIIRDYFKTTV